MHDGAALLNKDNHQVFGIQFSDTQIRHDNVIASCFRKPISHKVEMVAQLAQDFINEMFETNFQNAFSCSVQDLAASAAAKESLVDKVECDMHQGDEVGTSAVGELTWFLNKVNLLNFSIVFFLKFNSNQFYFL